MITLVLTAAGGLALFLLAMAMMTDGLRVFGGQGLKVLLRDWTSSPLRGVLSGALVTALVQSSSAVTVATIGFVNAGVLSLRQALGVVFGANVGTTMTAWLVALTGIGFKVEGFALPILAIGVALKLAAPGKRLQGLGGALAGFGLFFLGLSILKEAFAGVTAAFGPDMLNGQDGITAIALYLGVGFLATVLTQSSSAAIAIVLTAAAESVVGFEAAAAAIIGANIGTTSTALLAVLHATPNARRVAAGHLVFNLVTGAVALLLLPAFVVLVGMLGRWLGTGGDPAPMLALFHTIFNLMGVALLLPAAGFMARHLERLFHTAEEDISRPRHLDSTLLATPVLAIDALELELRRLEGLVRALALSALQGSVASPALVQRRSEAVLALGQEINAFATSMRMESLSREVAETLPRALRVARYLEEADRRIADADTLRRQAAALPHPNSRRLIAQALASAADAIRPVEDADDDQAALGTFETVYQDAKAGLLAAAASHALDVTQVEHALDGLSHTRRLVEQFVKAALMLRTWENPGDSDLADSNDGASQPAADDDVPSS